MNSHTLTPDLGYPIAILSRQNARQDGLSSAFRSLASRIFAHCHLFPACRYEKKIRRIRPLISQQKRSRKRRARTLLVQVLTIPLSPSVITPASRSIHVTAVTCMLCASLATSMCVLLFHIRTLLSRPIFRGMFIVDVNAESESQER